MISKPVQFDHDPFNRSALNYGAGLEPLPPAAETLLQRVFGDYEQVDITQKLGGGFTQSRVLVVRPVRRDGGANLPLVLKVGPTWLIEQEQAGYTRYIRDKLAGRIELVTVELADDWGVLGYRLAGDGHFKHDSLARYCRQTESAVLAEMLTGRLFKRLATLWQNADIRPEPYPATKYDLLLPVHLVIEPQPLPPAASVFEVTPEQLTPDHLAPGDAVRLAGFIITEVDAEGREVTLDLPVETSGPKCSHRLRLQPVNDLEHYPVGEPMPVVEGRVVQTRRGRLQAEIDRILSSSVKLELTTDQLWLPDGDVLPNPLAHLAALLSDWPPVKLAYQHGDLNLENVLVDPATRDVTLIDFANAGLEHVLHDLLHLEMSVVTSLLAEALVEVGETPDLIGPVFYDRLHRAAVEDPALYTPPRLLQPALKKVYTILAAIRQTAQAYLARPNDWAEYYRGLALYLVGALKFKDLDEVPAAPYPKQLALMGAVQAVVLWQQPEARSIPAADLSPVTAELQTVLAGSGFNLSQETLPLPDGTSLLNPLMALPDLLEPWIGPRWGRVHGRLDLATLVSELASDPNALIEAEVGPDERLHHLLRLETGVAVGVLPHVLTEAGQPPELIRFLIYERLHRAATRDPAQFALPKAIHPALARPYTLLAAIRRQATRFLTSEADWTDYYRGLALYLLGVLRLSGTDDSPPSIPPKGEEKPPLPQGEGRGEGENPPNHITFLTAALAADLHHTPTPRPHPPTPYLGLHAFQEADAPFFFGRDAFIDQLAELVPHRPLLAVTGASGSGKSSVVLAGLLPRLRQVGGCVPVIVRPGSAPFEELAQALVPLIERRFSDDLVHTWAETLRQGQQSLANLLSQRLSATPNPPRRLLIIDQFEELYTLCPDPDTRTRFINMLLAGGQGPEARDQELEAGGQGSETDNQHSLTAQSPNLPISNLQSPQSPIS